MATHNKTLNLIASKLGLADDDKVMGKAAEFERLLQTKMVAGSNVTDTSKIVICLDLAAGLLGADLDLKTAIKYSGLKPTMYNNSKKMIQNLLEIDTNKLTTSILCAALQCTGVQALADRILEQYQSHAKMEIDLNLPQYVCMAVYHACRISKVKVSKVKINEKSRLKPAQWAKLDADWAKFVDEHFAGAKKKRGRPPKQVHDIDPEPMDIDLPQKEEPSEPEIEPYEEWKRRMLETAYKELRELEKLQTQKKDLIFDGKSEPKKKDLRFDSKLETNKKELRIEVEKLDTKKTDSRIDLETKKKDLRIDSKYDTKKEELRIDKEMLTPRRSPRKTPQKYSPYKSPAKGKGVRLLFSLDS